MYNKNYTYANFEHKNKANRMLFYTEGSIMHLGACT